MYWHARTGRSATGAEYATAMPDGSCIQRSHQRDTSLPVLSAVASSRSDGSISPRCPVNCVLYCCCLVSQLSAVVGSYHNAVLAVTAIVIRVKARTSRLFSLIFGCLDSKPKVLDCAIKTTKVCSFLVFYGAERFVSTQT